MFHDQHVLTDGMYLPFLPPVGISIVDSFLVQSGSLLIISQLSRCRNLGLK